MLVLLSVTIRFVPSVCTTVYRGPPPMTVPFPSPAAWAGWDRFVPRTRPPSRAAMTANTTPVFHFRDMRILRYRTGVRPEPDEQLLLCLRGAAGMRTPRCCDATTLAAAGAGSPRGTTPPAGTPVNNERTVFLHL